MNKVFISKGDFLIEFKKFLLESFVSEKSVLLIIDEAQRLNHELLEQIRLLSNIELDNRKLLNIFFVGQAGNRKIYSTPAQKGRRHPGNFQTECRPGSF
jgi:general secretion pathway protein A